MRLSGQAGVGASRVLRGCHRPPRVHLAMDGPEALEQASGTITYAIPMRVS